MRAFDYKVQTQKCQCGHEVCDYHGLSDGSFHQGTGWNKATAEEHARRWNEAMTEERALEVFRREAFDPAYSIHKNIVVLEAGNYTADELEAIAWWMRNKEVK